MITVTLPWPDRNLWPNGRAHRLVRYRYEQQAKTYAYYATLEALTPTRVAGYNSQPIKLTLVAHPTPRTKSFDDDGLIGAFKHYRDGIALALGIDDKLFQTQPIIRGAVRKGGAVIVRIGE